MIWRKKGKNFFLIRSGNVLVAVRSQLNKYEQISYIIYELLVQQYQKGLTNMFHVIRNTNSFPSLSSLTANSLLYMSLYKFLFGKSMGTNSAAVAVTTQMTETVPEIQGWKLVSCQTDPVQSGLSYRQRCQSLLNPNPFFWNIVNSGNIFIQL